MTQKIVDVATKIAKILKDPCTDSRGNKLELTVEDRGKKREAAYNDLIECIELLAGMADVAEGLNEIHMIEKKYD